MAKEATRVRHRERKNITSGVAHVTATFNNTMITITDAQGNAISWSSAGTRGSRAPASRPPSPPRSPPRTRCAKPPSMAWRRSRSRSPAPVRGAKARCGRSRRSASRHRDPRRDADPAQRLPPAQASAGLITVNQGDLFKARECGGAGRRPAGVRSRRKKRRAGARDRSGTGKPSSSRRSSTSS